MRSLGGITCLLDAIFASLDSPVEEFDGKQAGEEKSFAGVKLCW